MPTSLCSLWSLIETTSRAFSSTRVLDLPLPETRYEVAEIMHALDARDKLKVICVHVFAR